MDGTDRKMAFRAQLGAVKEVSWEGGIKNEVKGPASVPKITVDPNVVHGIKSSYSGIRIKLRD